jgi:hypothetical protein
VRRARYLVRQTLAQGLYGVTRHYWYDAVDDAWDSFGLLKCVTTPSWECEEFQVGLTWP